MAFSHLYSAALSVVSEAYPAWIIKLGIDTIVIDNEEITQRQGRIPPTEGQRISALPREFTTVQPPVPASSLRL